MRLVPPEPSTVLTEEEFGERFEREWERLTSRFFKFERLQEYRVPDDPSFQAFERGDLEEARRRDRENILAQKPLYDAAHAKGVILVRVRVVELPLSDYLRLYELPSYRVSAACGEEIRITRADQHQELLTTTRLSDFIAFDDRVVLVNKYDEGAAPDGAWLVEQPQLVKRFVDTGEQLLATSVSLDEFLGSVG